MKSGKNTIARIARRGAAGVLAAVTYLLLDAPAAMAQVVQSDAQAQPGSSETTQLVTSSTEVRRAVIGLVVIAGVVGLITIFYWFKTGQQARERFARRYGGRHRAGQAGHELADEAGPWRTDPEVIPAPQPAFVHQERPQPMWEPTTAPPARRRPEFHD